MFDSGMRRVCVVLGAAGWGKTTAVAAWAGRHRSVWLPNGPGLDAVAIVSALRDAVGAGGGRTPEAPLRDIDPGDGGTPGTAAAVCEWLRQSLQEELVVVIDDVHQLPASSEAVRLIEGLCRYAPERLRLVLVSRRELPFSLACLRGQGLLTEIDAPKLAFDRSETETLLRQALAPDIPDDGPDDILDDILDDGPADRQGDVPAVPAALTDAVWARTGGWPAALRAAVEALAQIGGPGRPGWPERLDVLERLVLPGERFHTYLAEEVIGPESVQAQHYLRRVAVFGEIMDPAAAGRDVQDPSAVLADLTRRGLLRHIPGDVPRWTLLPPLGAWLQHETVMPRTERAGLHLVAAGECRSRGAYAQALRHLVAAGDREGALSLLIDHGADLVSTGAADAVLKAADLMQAHPDDTRLQRTLGEAQQLRGYWVAAFESYRRAGADEQRLEPGLAWRMMWLLMMQGEFGQIPGVFENVVEGCGDTLDEVSVLAQVATAHRLLGDLPAAERFASRALGTARRSGRRAAKAVAHNVLGVLAAAAGDHRRMDAHFTIAANNLEAGNDLLQTLWVRICRAMHLLELGAPREARAEAEELRALLTRYEIPFLEAHVSTISARASLRLGALDTAAAEFTAAVDLFQRIGSRFLAWPLAGLGDVYRARGQLARARAAYEEALTMCADGPDSIGLSHALLGLARVRAADDLSVARGLADRAVAVSEGLHMVPALLTRGWVALLAGDRPAAALDAVGAATAARCRRDDLGLAEAILLGVQSSEDPAADADRLTEAIQIWQEAGCVLEEATTRVVAGALGGTRSRIDADRAVRTLRASGVDVEARRGAGPLAVLLRSAPPVTIRTLGVFQVIHDGVPLPKSAWQSKKARDLLKILIARRRPTPRDRLLELLWPDGDPAKCANRLSVLMSMLRDILHLDRSRSCPLVSEGAVVWLDRSLVRIDVDDFLERADVALKAYRGGEPDAKEQLAAALAAHDGDFLADEPYEDWAAQLTEEVRAKHLSLLRALIVTLRAVGDVDQVVESGLRLLEQDPYDEEVRLDLVGALLDAGRLGEARRHYESYRRAMQEIDVEPRPMPRLSRATPARPAPLRSDPPRSDPPRTALARATPARATPARGTAARGTSARTASGGSTPGRILRPGLHPQLQQP